MVSAATDESSPAIDPPGTPEAPPVTGGDIRSSVTIDAPATTANLGAGFDTLALALDLSNRTTVDVVDGPAGSVELVVVGEGTGALDASGNRFTRALRMGLSQLGQDPGALALRITMHNRIPLSRGLGSSASATVAGLLAAGAIAGESISPERMLVLACQSEGHADNAAAAVLGGFVVVSHAGGDARAVRLDPPAALVAALYIPDRPLSTAAMRAALPASVPFGDAVHNVGASSMIVAAFATGRLDLLAAAAGDRLHEPYRAAAVYPELPGLIAAARSAGALSASMSGAGSSVIALADDAELAAEVGAAVAKAAAGVGLKGRAVLARPRGQGAFVVESRPRAAPEA